MDNSIFRPPACRSLADQMRVGGVLAALLTLGLAGAWRIPRPTLPRAVHARGLSNLDLGRCRAGGQPLLASVEPAVGNDNTQGLEQLKKWDSARFIEPAFFNNNIFRLLALAATVALGMKATGPASRPLNLFVHLLSLSGWLGAWLDITNHHLIPPYLISICLGA
jgi:hypothetical protein